MGNNVYYLFFKRSNSHRLQTGKLRRGWVGANGATHIVQTSIRIAQYVLTLIKKTAE